MNTNIQQLIEATRGKIFRIVFTKRTTGERRTMLARTGVRKNITGEGLKFNPSARNLKLVWSMGDRGYRFVPIESVLEFSCGSMKWRAA